MKIVYLNPSGQLGGAEICLLDLLASIRAAEPGWSLHLVLPEDGPLASRARESGVPITVLPFPPAVASLGDSGAGGPAGRQQSRLALLGKLLGAGPVASAYARRLGRVLRDLNPDVIHSNGFKMHILGTWAKPQRVPLIWHVHDYASTRPAMSRFMRKFSTRCAVAVANSRSVAEDVRAVCGKHLTVRTVYNGIDLERFSPIGPRLDLDTMAELTPAAPDTVRVGMLATLARWKGHETFLQAFSLLPQNLSVRGYVLGAALYQTTGSQHSLAELRALATRLGISHRVGFTGFLKQPASAVRALDIVIHASTHPEPFGLVIAEAMACGRPVIVSEAGGAMELIDANINALGHPPGDAARLAECIASLATDPSLRARLGAAGRATAERRFDRARLATELVPIYRAVLDGSTLQSAA